MKWADRIIFGTDDFWFKDDKLPNDIVLKQHMRFVTSLDLPGDVLDKVCHGNIERLYKIDPCFLTL